MKEQLDKITIQVESLKQAQTKILETHGVAHSSARYIQKLEDDYSRLRQKYNQILATRQQEAIKYNQHLKQCQQMNHSLRPPRPPRSPTPMPTPPRQPPKITGTNTSTPIRKGNSRGSSATISLSSSSGSSFNKTPPTSSSSSLEEDTLEITDVRFFDKMEDQTMIEVNNLMNKMRSTLKSVKEL
jgi:hypothetical protein